MELEQTIDALEKEKEALDGTIEELEKYKELWEDIPNAKEDAENKLLASSILGSNYEQVILENRIVDIESFKDSYISVQKQIDDNTSMIESYEEKVEYYEKLKQQWEDITNAYDEAQEDLLVSQYLGADWEKTILEDRGIVVNEFKNQYVAAQQEMANAAWESAKAQVEAAQYAARNGSGPLPDPEKIEVSRDFLATSDEEYETYEFGGITYNSKSARDAAEAKYKNDLESAKQAAAEKILEEQAKAEAKALEEKQEQERLEQEERLKAARDAIRNGGSLAKYHDGLNKGYVSSKYRELTDDEMLTLFQKFGNGKLKPGEVPALLKQGELVMTPEQQENMAKNMQTLYGNNIIQNNIPDNMIANNSSTPVVQNITLTLPNVTNNSGYERLQKELQQMQIDAMQIAHKR